MSTEQFDLEEIYDDHISPLMKQIIEICTKYKMPLVAMFQFGTDDHCATTMAFDRASERMEDLITRMQLRKHYALAVTEATAPDGPRTITVSRIA